MRFLGIRPYSDINLVLLMGVHLGDWIDDCDKKVPFGSWGCSVGSGRLPWSEVGNARFGDFFREGQAGTLFVAVKKNKK